MGLSDRLAAVRDYILASFVPAPDHPGRGGMTGEPASDSEGEAGATSEGEAGATSAGEAGATSEGEAEETDEKR